MNPIIWRIFWSESCGKASDIKTWSFDEREQEKSIKSKVRGRNLYIQIFIHYMMDLYSILLIQNTNSFGFYHHIPENLDWWFLQFLDSWFSEVEYLQNRSDFYLVQNYNGVVYTFYNQLILFSIMRNIHYSYLWNEGLS